MKEIQEKQQIFKIKLSREELEFIRELSGVPIKDEQPLDKKYRMELYIGASGMLGYNVVSNGNSIKTPMTS